MRIPYDRVQGSGYNTCTGKYCIICPGGTKKAYKCIGFFPGQNNLQLRLRFLPNILPYLSNTLLTLYADGKPACHVKPIKGPGVMMPIGQKMKCHPEIQGTDVFNPNYHMYHN
jgi:hypothetical protein